MKISYECSEIIEELLEDIAEFGRNEPAYGVWKEMNVKVPFADKYIKHNILVNYLLGDDDPQDFYKPGEVAILSTLGELLPIFQEQNEIF